jgi:hypothetical protein
VFASQAIIRRGTRIFLLEQEWRCPRTEKLEWRPVTEVASGQPFQNA